MKKIVKGTSLQDFEQWKSDNTVTISTRFAAGESGGNLWDFFKDTAKPIFKDTRLQILEEQFYLCAYCNRKIHVDTARIDDTYTTLDHIVPKSNDPVNLTFDYDNLVGSCDGARKNPRLRILHCDAQKNNNAILVSPLQSDCEDLIYYTSNGDIAGISSAITDNLNEILGLNCSKLKNERENTIKGYIEDPDTADGLIDIPTAQELLESINQNPPFEYSSAIASVLKREILSV